MKKTKEEAEFTRELLLKVALIIFNRKGFSKTRLEDVAREANVTRGAIYWHFENKYDLYYTLIKEYTPDVEKEFSIILNKEESPLKRIRQCIKHFCEILEQDEEFQAIVKLIFINTSLPDESDEMIKVISKRQRSIMRLMSMVIHEGIQCGEVRSNVNPDATAILLNCCLIGIAEMWHSKIIAFSPRKNADVLIDNFIKGIETK